MGVACRQAVEKPSCTVKGVDSAQNARVLACTLRFFADFAKPGREIRAVLHSPEDFSTTGYHEAR